MKSKQFLQEGLADEVNGVDQDHEVQMARADCYYAAQAAIKLHKILARVSEQQGLEGWVSEKITLAADYLKNVCEYMEHEVNTPQFPVIDPGMIPQPQVSEEETMDEGVFGDLVNKYQQSKVDKAAAKAKADFLARRAELAKRGQATRTQAGPSQAWDHGGYDTAVKRGTMEEGRFTVNAKTGAKLDPRTGAELPPKAKPVTSKQMWADADARVAARSAGPDLDTVWRKVEYVVGQIFPDGDPIDYLGPWLEKQGVSGFKIGEILDAASKKHGYNDIYDYWGSLEQEYGDLTEVSRAYNDERLGGKLREESGAVNTDQLLEFLTAAWSTIRQNDMYTPAGKQTISRIYEGLRYDLMQGDFAGFEKAWEEYGAKYPDHLDELADAAFEEAGLDSRNATYEDFVAAAGEVSEGIMKNIKRGLQGWDKNAVGPGGERLGDPRAVAKRAKSLGDNDLRSVHSAVNNPGAGIFGNGEFKNPNPHSPAGLQKRVLDREMKKRGLGEAKGDTIEAHGIRGMNRKPWRKTFKNAAQMNAWADKYDAEILGTRDLEQAKKGVTTEMASMGATGVGSIGTVSMPSVKKVKKRIAEEDRAVVDGSETASDIDKKIEFHKQGQAAAQYKGSMNKMHAAKIRELEAKKKALKNGSMKEMNLAPANSTAAASATAATKNAIADKLRKSGNTQLASKLKSGGGTFNKDELDAIVGAEATATKKPGMA